MDDHELIQDTGLFVGQKLFEFSLTESFDSIMNLLKTIKEYRDYASPDEAAWFGYIHEIFHVMGFSTNQVAQRLITLQEFGTSQTPKALVCIIGPKEDFTNIVYGLNWESYLFYAAKFHQVEWVILTNGLQFKVLNFTIDPDRKKFFKCELDEIIQSGKTDSFLTLYRIFSVINKSPENRTVDEKGKRVIVERHLVRKEFWAQLLSKSKSKTKLFARKTPGIEAYLNISGGRRGLYFSFDITYESARIELYIDNGDGTWNKSVFDSFLKNKSKIEEVFGEPLVWDRLENNRASAIRFLFDQYGLKDKDQWPEIQDQMIDAMIRLEKAFRPYINKIG
jgi:hypothetical protein